MTSLRQNIDSYLDTEDDYHTQFNNLDLYKHGIKTGYNRKLLYI